MITIQLEDCNSFSQDIYDTVINHLQFHQMKCKCGRIGCLILYGHYKRHLKLLCAFICLIIQRVRCTNCGRTHSLIPSLVVPYSQIPRKDQQEILELSEADKSPGPVLERNNLIDENNVKHVIRRFRQHWKERIKSIGRTLSDSLTEPCLSTYSRQFMQIHRTWNIFFPPPT